MRIETNWDEQTALRDLLHLIASGSDLQSTIKTVLAAAQSFTGAAGCHFVGFEQPGLRVSLGAEPGWLSQIESLRRSVSVPGGEIQRGSPELSGETGTTLAVPISAKGKLIGGLWLCYSEEYHLSDTARDLLKSLADGISVALQLQTGFEQRLYRIARSFIDAMSDPIFVLDADKRILLINSAAENAFHLAWNQSQGQTFREAMTAQPLVEMIEEGKSINECETDDGSFFMPRLQALDSASGGLEGWVLVLRDMSLLKKLNRNQSEFMRIVSHDLRSPLTSMQGFASMLESGMVGELNDKQIHFVEKILAGITQITALVDNIQDAGRFDPETGFYEMSRSHCDLGAMVKQVVNTHLVPAEKQELSIHVIVDDNVPIINADANMLERAVTNLVDNAIKYTPNGGKIEIAVRKEGGRIVISVKDNGHGISPEQQKLLFQRHVRLARQEHIRIKGSGLGLFIVRSVARRHGGDAWVESIEKQGSTFLFSIPLQGDNLILPG